MVFTVHSEGMTAKSSCVFNWTCTIQQSALRRLEAMHNTVHTTQQSALRRLDALH